MHLRARGGSVQGMVPSASDMAPRIEMLSFFDMLPPPDFRDVMGLRRPEAYKRAVGRGLDLSHLTAMRRLILIGHLEEGPNPTPLRVDGRRLPARGWTVVRWIAPVAEGGE